MNVGKTTRLLIFALLLSSQSFGGGNSAVKQAAKAVTEAFSTTSYVAKMDLRRYAHHYVHPDGSPSTTKGKKKQGRGGEGSIKFDDGVKVHAGEIGEAIHVWAKNKEIQVGLNRKRGKVLNPAIVHIIFDRPIEAADLTPEKIARAVSSVVVIKGFEPGADIAAAFNELLDSAPTPSASSAPSASSTSSAVTGNQTPTVVSLNVSVKPATVRLGGEVQLVLDYVIQASAGDVIAIETRSLSFNGVLVPTYPVNNEIPRGAGFFSSTYHQPLPAGAAAGTYRYKGEVCVDEDCISRSTTFELVR